MSADITAATRAIRVVPRSVNLLAEQGTLQVTVVNGLDYAVEDIRLKLVPNNPRIQIVEQPGPITIEPGSRAIVPVQVAAVAAGRAEIHAYLTTADGTLIGSPATIPVPANPLDADDLLGRRHARRDRAARRHRPHRAQGHLAHRRDRGHRGRHRSTRRRRGAGIRADSA